MPLKIIVGVVFARDGKIIKIPIDYYPVGGPDGPNYLSLEPAQHIYFEARR